MHKLIIHHRNLLYLEFRLYFPPVPNMFPVQNTQFSIIFFLLHIKYSPFFIQKSFCIILAVSYLRRRVGEITLLFPITKYFNCFHILSPRHTERTKKKKLELLQTKKILCELLSKTPFR